jgi:hypothetical protein
MTANRRIGRGATAELIALDGDRVAKRFRRGFATEVARREAANARLAREAGLPVPRVHSVTVSNGRPTIVYERVDGPTMRSRLCRPPGPRRHARRLAALQATVHSVDPGPTELPATRERLAGEIDRVPGLPAADGRRILSVLDGLPAGRGHPAADVARRVSCSDTAARPVSPPWRSDGRFDGGTSTRTVAGRTSIENRCERGNFPSQPRG